MTYLSKKTILNKLLDMDGVGSGLDADTLDGLHLDDILSQVITCNKVITVQEDTQVTNENNIYLVDASNSVINVTLPDNVQPGLLCIIKKTDYSNNLVYIRPQNTIDDYDYGVLDRDNESAILIYDGSKWYPLNYFRRVYDIEILTEKTFTYPVRISNSIVVETSSGRIVFTAWVENDSDNSGNVKLRVYNVANDTEIIHDIGHFENLHTIMPLGLDFVPESNKLLIYVWTFTDYLTQFVRILNCNIDDLISNELVSFDSIDVQGGRLRLSTRHKYNIESGKIALPITYVQDSHYQCFYVLSDYNITNVTRKLFIPNDTSLNATRNVSWQSVWSDYMNCEVCIAEAYNVNSSGISQLNIFGLNQHGPRYSIIESRLPTYTKIRTPLTAICYENSVLFTCIAVIDNVTFTDARVGFTRVMFDGNVKFENTLDLLSTSTFFIASDDNYIVHAIYPKFESSNRIVLVKVDLNTGKVYPVVVLNNVCHMHTEEPLYNNDSSYKTITLVNDDSRGTPLTRGFSVLKSKKFGRNLVDVNNSTLFTKSFEFPNLNMTVRQAIRYKEYFYPNLVTA